MKYIVTLLAAIILTVYIFSLKKNINDLEANLSHLNNMINVRVDKKINDARKHVTDSLIKEFNNLDPVTETKIKIQYKYEKVIDTIYLMPSSEQLDYVTRELNRLYPNH